MKAILFDLDGTLLPMDSDLFMILYATEITQAFEGFEESKIIFPQIMKSIGEVVQDRTDKTNYEKFFISFEKAMTLNREAYIQVFDKFYEDRFLNIKRATSSSASMLEAVELLKEKGYRLIIATNPIFPMAANRHRIAWAGLNINDFEYISSFEENKHCKPSLEYYQEVLDKTGLKAEDVMMVGNDVQEDLVIQSLGATTYLIENHMINRKPDEVIHPDYSGSYDDFLDFVKGLS